MKRVIIVGGGYAGLSAAAKLAGHESFAVELYDRRDVHHALPVLPDIVGRNFRPEGLRYSLTHAARRFGFTFLQEEVTSLQLDEPMIVTESRTRNADAILLATGTRTAFHGFSPARQYGYTLDDLDDALAIRSVLTRDDWDTAVVCGGGYTGVELVTALWRWSERNNARRRIILTDIAPSLCAALPEKMREYVTENVRSMGIEIRTETPVEHAGQRMVRLKGDLPLDRALLFWTAGMEAPPLAQKVEVDKDRQGRLIVDNNLQISDRCFAAGDAAVFRENGNTLRMSVHFAITQGRHAAQNIKRHLAGLPLRPFRPFDPGYLVPMANNRACGNVLGKSVFGRVGIGLHYLMCIARSVGLTNRRMILVDSVRSLLGRE